MYNNIMNTHKKLQESKNMYKKQPANRYYK